MFTKHSQLRFLKVPVVVHTNSFKMTEQKHFEEFFDIIETISIQSLVIDHIESWRTNDQCCWSLDYLKMFSGKVQISEISTDCLEISQENVIEFIKTIAKFKHCRVILPDSIHYYQFTV